MGDSMSQDDEKQEVYLSYLCSKEQSLLANLGPHAKTQKKRFSSEFGTLDYMFIYVRNKQGKLFSPLRDYLGLGPYMSMTAEFRAKLVMKCSRTSYQKAVEDTQDSFGVKVSKKTLFRYVAASSPANLCSKPKKGQNILLCDSTKVRQMREGHHSATAMVSLNAESKSASLAACGVNKPLEALTSGLDLAKYDAFVGDGDLAFRPLYADGKLPFHLCHQHGIHDLSFYLWQEKMDKENRKRYDKWLKAHLYALQKSTAKYWLDHDKERLTARIEKTRMGLQNIAEELEKTGSIEGPRYLRVHQEHLLTAAILALQGIHVPFTTNYIEKVMQEIGVRTKKKSMNWGERGLSAMMRLTLSRFFTPQKERNYKLALCSNMQVIGA